MWRMHQQFNYLRNLLTNANYYLHAPLLLIFLTAETILNTDRKLMPTAPIIIYSFVKVI